MKGAKIVWELEPFRAEIFEISFSWYLRPCELIEGMWNLHELTGLPQDDQNVIFHMIFYLLALIKAWTWVFDEGVDSGCVYKCNVGCFGQ